MFDFKIGDKVDLVSELWDGVGTITRITDNNFELVNEYGNFYTFDKNKLLNIEVLE